MTKLPLERRAVPTWSEGFKVIHWTSCLPFVENRMATLIHRPRSVTTYRNGPRPPHIAVHNWCGNGMVGSSKFTFLPVPPLGRIVCAKCEYNAVRAGFPETDQLAGAHIHKGGVVAVPNCCEVVQ